MTSGKYGLGGRRDKNTDLFNRITNTDIRIHLPVSDDEECRNYLMSRRETLVGWKMEQGQGSWLLQVQSENVKLNVCSLPEKYPS